MFEGVQYFQPRAGRGKFVKLLSLKPDKRFVDVATTLRGIKVGSKVQFGSQHRTYGVITWMETISDEEYVKVQMVSHFYSIKNIIMLCMYECSFIFE